MKGFHSELRRVNFYDCRRVKDSKEVFYDKNGKTCTSVHICFDGDVDMCFSVFCGFIPLCEEWNFFGDTGIR